MPIMLSRKIMTFFFFFSKHWEQHPFPVTQLQLSLMADCLFAFHLGPFPFECVFSMYPVCAYHVLALISVCIPNNIHCWFGYLDTFRCECKGEAGCLSCDDQVTRADCTRHEQVYAELIHSYTIYVYVPTNRHIFFKVLSDLFGFTEQSLASSILNFMPYWAI